MEHKWMHLIVLDHWADPVTYLPLSIKERPHGYSWPPFKNVLFNKRESSVFRVHFKTENTAKLILPWYNCCKILAKFWCMIWGAQLVFKWTYMHLSLWTRTFSSWKCKFADANSFCAWYMFLAPAIAHVTLMGQQHIWQWNKKLLIITFSCTKSRHQFTKTVTFSKIAQKVTRYLGYLFVSNTFQKHPNLVTLSPTRGLIR